MQDQMYNNQANGDSDYQRGNNTKENTKSTQERNKVKEELGDYVDFEEIEEK